MLLHVWWFGWAAWADGRNIYLRILYQLSDWIRTLISCARFLLNFIVIWVSVNSIEGRISARLASSRWNITTEAAGYPFFVNVTIFSLSNCSENVRFRLIRRYLLGLRHFCSLNCCMSWKIWLDQYLGRNITFLNIVLKNWSRVLLLRYKDHRWLIIINRWCANRRTQFTFGGPWDHWEIFWNWFVKLAAWLVLIHYFRVGMTFIKLYFFIGCRCHWTSVLYIGWSGVSVWRLWRHLKFWFNKWGHTNSALFLRRSNRFFL